MGKASTYFRKKLMGRQNTRIFDSDWKRLFLLPGMSFIFFKKEKYIYMRSNVSQQEAQESSSLKISEKFLHADGSYLSTLRIVSANVEDSGKYICVVFRKGKESTYIKHKNVNFFINPFIPTGNTYNCDRKYLLINFV